MTSKPGTNALSVLLLATQMFSCSSNPISSQKIPSNFQFISTSKPNMAIIESRDLNDEFLLGIRVANVKDFYSGIYALQITKKVKLVLEKDAVGNTKLLAIDAKAVLRGEKIVIFIFDVIRDSFDNLLVDFASVSNPLNLQNLSEKAPNEIVSTEEEKTNTWRTTTKPKTLKLFQDSDGIVADVEHKVSYSTAETSEKNATNKSGTVLLRIFLKRLSNIPELPYKYISALQSTKKGLGFFGSSGDIFHNPIRRFNVNMSSQKPGQITVYLKNFSEDMYPVAERAILVWNKAFGFEAIKVLPATIDIDVGDPKYTVVRWVENVDTSAVWAGFAGGDIVDPNTGTILAGCITINGSDKDYALRTHHYMQTAALSGSLGSNPIVIEPGEFPVLPFGTNPNITSNKKLIENSYFAIIVHEFGHSLGLRHNFKASTMLEDTPNLKGVPVSVMDYMSRYADEATNDIGSYDIAAIRWAYAGHEPQQKFPFCTDEDLAKQFDCNQFDYGDPISYIPYSINKGLELIKQTPLEFFQFSTGPRIWENGLINLIKLNKLSNQIPDKNRQEKLKAELSKAFISIENAKPSADLNALEQEIVAKNLTKLRYTTNALLKGK